MALVDYDSSDDTEKEVKPSTPTRPKPENSSPRPAFQKLVDTSNRSKIKVTLAHSAASDDQERNSDEHSAKKAKTGGGGFKDFNNFLPPPKRPAARGVSNRAGHGKGVSLKTGATPGFTREPMPSVHAERERGEEASNGADKGAQEQESRAEPVGIPELPVAAPGVQSTKKSTMFKPLSVAQKKQKKKPPLATGNGPTIAKADDSVQSAATSVPRILLFPNHNTVIDDMAPISNAKKDGEYKPMLYQSSTHTVGPSNPTAPPNPDPSSILPESNQDQSLDAIASSLNLTPNQKRQLLGRKADKNSAQAIQVTSFDIDAEYAANEVLRQSGETVQHQAVRPIAGGGKHSLKQLVSSAVGQRDALEEKFAVGSRNRKEGSARYGW